MSPEANGLARAEGKEVEQPGLGLDPLASFKVTTEVFPIEALRSDEREQGAHSGHQPGSPVAVGVGGERPNWSGAKYLFTAERRPGPPLSIAVGHGRAKDPLVGHSHAAGRRTRDRRRARAVAWLRHGPK